MYNLVVYIFNFDISWRGIGKIYKIVSSEKFGKFSMF